MCILIGRDLEQAVAAIICRCGFEIQWGVLDQIEHDAASNQVDAKDYVLHESNQVRLAAHVNDYEPETEILRLERGLCHQFDKIIIDASTHGFATHAYWFDQPLDAPQFLVDILSAPRFQASAVHPLGRTRLLAVDRSDAITRCYYPVPHLRPTPYRVCATNLRTMDTRKLGVDEAGPFIIKNYK